MRLHRFYTSETIGSKTDFTICSNELVNQIYKVFRMKVGDLVILFDGSGNDYKCSIVNMDLNKNDKNSIDFHIENFEPSRFTQKHEIVLCAAIVKKDTFEWIVEKATELGVTKIIPIVSERSEKKNLNEERLNKIVIEASEQSGRGSIPIVDKIRSLNEAIEYIKKSENLSPIKLVAFHTEGDSLEGSSIFSGSIIIFIGPEGGWSSDEVEVFHKNNIPVIKLGNQVLRSETAVVAALSLVTLDR